jgi:hypothetical protein
MLQKGELLPHFSVASIAGDRFAYSEIMQRKNLVLVSVPHEESKGSTTYLAQFAIGTSELTGDDTACLITRDSIPGVPVPGVVVADRWGEIHHVTHAARVEDLPSFNELVDWLRYVQSQCPECEGEAK